MSWARPKDLFKITIIIYRCHAGWGQIYIGQDKATVNSMENVLNH